MAEHGVDPTLTERDRCLVDLVTGLPRKILRYHNVDGLAQMVLHELGHDGGFGFQRATYLIDNPDFDHLRGVAGYSHQECKYHKDNIWDNPDCFRQDMEQAEFHNNVRSILNNSFKRNDINLDDADDVRELGSQLGMEEPSFFSWDMKHGNHGLFIYEKDDNICLWRHGLLKNISAMLSMCGIR